MKYRIAGYGGQHEEAGARIVDQDHKRVLTTPALESNTEAGWRAYHERNRLILNALNGHEPMIGALKTAKGVIESEYPEDQWADRGVPKINKALLAAGLSVEELEAL